MDDYANHTYIRISGLKLKIFLTASSVLLILVSTSLSIAQDQSRIDSLLNNLKTAKGLQAVQNYILLGVEFKEFAPEKTIEYADKAIQIATHLSDKKHLAWAIRLKGKGYKYQQKYQEAKRYFLQSLALEEEINNSRGIAECFEELGDAYKGRREFSSALKYYKKALDLFEKLEDKRGTMVVLNNLADTYEMEDQFKNSVTFATKAMDLAMQLNDEREANRATLILSKSYADLENYENAYKFYVLHTEIRDSIARREKAKEIAAIEKKFEEERRRELAAQEEREARTYRNNLQYLVIFIFFGVVFGGLFFLPQIGIPDKIISTAIFLSLFLGVQFMLLLLSPISEKYTGGNPIPRLALNAFFAYILLLINRYFDRRIKEKVFEDDKKKPKKNNLEPTDKVTSAQENTNNTQENSQIAVSNSK
ncbi:MAG: tetratricopeptide repeat protein [Microscillaceae bacterium]|nr:tetratricopeptide repeat protein [Microscillaceae bacterium]MDW8460104.1 tetratricopeptide repeat protein [Cytophagales bacterium]